MPTSPPSKMNDTEVSGSVRRILAVEGSTQSIDLQVPLDDSFATVVRLAVAAMADEAGIGHDHTEVAREEIGAVFTDLCRNGGTRPTATLHVEVGSGALLVETRTSDGADPVTVRWWAPVPEPT